MLKRIQRVDELLKRELGLIILREFEFPKDILVTLTRVEVLENLNEAKIYISIFPEKESKKILEILTRNIYFIQQKLNKKLKMRPVPKIRFLLEKKVIEASRVEELLEQLKKEKK